MNLYAYESSSCTIREKRQGRTRVTGRKKKNCSHWAPESICVIISEKESVTNLTGTVSFWSIRGDVSVGGEMVRMIKSYKKNSIHILKALKSHI